MVRSLSLAAALLLLAPLPALAAPCATQGTVDAPLAFPKKDAGDIPFVRSMVDVVLPSMSGAVPGTPGCTRTTVATASGDYVIGGENQDAYPRVAMRADGKPGPVVYLAASPNAPGTLALVVHSKGATTVVTAFYAGIPTDARLAADVRAALADGGLADDKVLITYDAASRVVHYPFVPPGFVPPPPAGAGPQVFVAGEGGMKWLDTTRDGFRHKPSGFGCPQRFDGLAVLLMSVEPRGDYLACSYRAGTDLTFRPDDEIRYQLVLAKPRPGDTTRTVFDQLIAEGRAGLRIKGDHAPPLVTGPAPAPEFVAYWDAEDAGVQGVWVGKAGGWIVWLRAQYPPGAANDAEAGTVAKALFAKVAAEVK